MRKCRTVLYISFCLTILALISISTDRSNLYANEQYARKLMLPLKTFDSPIPYSNFGENEDSVGKRESSSINVGDHLTATSDQLISNERQIDDKLEILGNFTEILSEDTPNPVYPSSAEATDGTTSGRSKIADSEITLDDVFISVKTTAKYHSTRLKIILDTWYQLAPNQTYIFTDASDATVQKLVGSNLVVTGCGSSHRRYDLCCKMGQEYDKFMQSDKKWFCHVDDDNYLNPHTLVALLRQYPWNRDWYLGKPSIRNQLSAYEQDTKRKVSFWFATGGAGFCISRSLAVKMKPTIGNSQFSAACNKIYLPDDVTMGYVIEYLLKSRLTVVKQFRSHLEALAEIKDSDLFKQITLSYGYFGDMENVVKLSGGFSREKDPTRLYSLHCILFPREPICGTMSRQP